MSILQQSVNVINLGLEGFCQDLKSQSVPVVQVDWRPPAGGDQELVEALIRLRGPEVDKANRETVQRMIDARPLWIDVERAIDVIPGMKPNHLLHSGPPIAFETMCDPQQRAIEGAAIFEGWVENRDELVQKLERGEIELCPNYMLGSIGPMCGPISPSMPVIVTEDAASGKRAWSPFNEGKGNVLWMGTYDQGTIERLRWFRDHFGPGLKKALAQSETGIDIFQIIAEGVQMGDEVHARSGACTSLLFKKLLPLLLQTDLDKESILAIAKTIDANSHFFLNLTLTACKVAAEAAHGVKNSTVVTAMSRNGVDFALRIGGSDRWYIAKTAPMDEAIYYAGYSVDDAAGDIGDSAIVETLGLGGMVIGAACTLSSFVGGSMADLWSTMKKMQTICVGSNPRFAPAAADFMPAPLGIDIRKVVQNGLTPIIDTGVIHKSSGKGQIGAGIARAPMEVFVKALKDKENYHA
ncbi:DUF1116 domain-containing protein [Geomonas subterranea]|uniref:DUF1116 domain-containing protein n=1 Tax=Geomonas subterranea TaxID=2847989 RepID=A0ABX8LT38_9BACT|nr:DUF1116 domain-containing protein [Geomonas subterranea]QXE92655.1 DUF1116 domain-containing protein [Geomonas subterranea]QXM09246.1 DUF1116 domain-containing protein [Geomonas subterranea]